MEHKPKILVVDDIEINREILKMLLEDQYEVLEAYDGYSALDVIRENFSTLSLILLDLMMPGMDGFQLLEQLKKNNMTNIPVIIITANSELEQEKRGLSLGAVDFVPKPFDPDVVRYRVEAHVKLKNYQDHLEHLVEASVEKMSDLWISVIQKMADIIEYRNQVSGEHVKRTSKVAQLMLQNLHTRSVLGYMCTPKHIRYMYEAASLHDVGKIGIPDAILNKPGRLTPEEFEIMKTHTTIGFDIAKQITEFGDEDYRRFCCEICLSHHEKWDGTGYPNKMSGENIPLSARIVAIADTYDAITNDRPYSVARSHETALAIIKEMSGSQFDPFLVEVFTDIEQEVKKGLAK